MWNNMEPGRGADLEGQLWSKKCPPARRAPAGGPGAQPGDATILLAVGRALAGGPGAQPGDARNKTTQIITNYASPALQP